MPVVCEVVPSDCTNCTDCTTHPGFPAFGLVHGQYYRDLRAVNWALRRAREWFFRRAPLVIYRPPRRQPLHPLLRNPVLVPVLAPGPVPVPVAPAEDDFDDLPDLVD